jgi:hypothetical protein
MNLLVSAMSELEGKLASFPCRVLAYRESVPSGLCGSYVSVSGASAEHIVGLLSHPLSWESLGRALDRDRPAAEPRGLVEGACDLARIVAHTFRGQLGAGAGTAWAVGAPLFTDGLVSSARPVDVEAADIALGGCLVLLVLFSRTALEREAE